MSSGATGPVHLQFNAGGVTFEENTVSLNDLLSAAAKVNPVVVHSSVSSYSIGMEDICVLSAGTIQVVLPASKPQGYKVQIVNYTGGNLTIVTQGSSIIYNVFYVPPSGSSALILKPNSNVIMYYVGSSGNGQMNWMSCIG